LQNHADAEGANWFGGVMGSILGADQLVRQAVTKAMT
jgi:hypothetical protein